MTKHITDNHHSTPSDRLLFRYANLAKKRMPHRSSKKLQKRVTSRSNGSARRLAYLRIEAGRIA